MTKSDWGTTAYLTQFSHYNGLLMRGEVPITIGRKYITIQERWKRQFYIEDGLELGEYTSGFRFFPSREAADSFIREREIRRRLDKYLSYEGTKAANNLTIEQQEQLLQFFEHPQK
jgi:hypothetical protein